jgi:hypothetical protein
MTCRFALDPASDSDPPISRQQPHIDLISPSPAPDAALGLRVPSACSSISLPHRQNRSRHHAGQQIPHAQAASPRVAQPARAPIDYGSHYVDRYARWLAQWIFCFCRHPEVAIDALAIVGRLYTSRPIAGSQPSVQSPPGRLRVGRNQALGTRVFTARVPES